MKPIRSSILSVLALGWLVHGASAQEAFVVPPDATPLTAAPEMHMMVINDPAADSPGLWASGEYLLWKVRKGPLPFPVVTATDIAVAPPGPGALGEPDVVVVFGNSHLDYGTDSGARVTLGAWLNRDQTFGIEGSGFALEQRSTAFRISSDGQGNPLLAFPVFNTDFIQNSEDALAVSQPGITAGAISVISTTRLWGAEVDGVWNLWQSSTLSVQGLTGFRYADLRETLTMDLVAVTLPGIAVPTITTAGRDFFGVHNTFEGGQVGARVGGHYNGVGFALTGKLGLGDTRELLTIAGNTQVINPPAGFPALSSGSIYTQPTNIGTYTRDHFALMPEVEAQISFDLTRNLRALVGYNYLYWSDVLRPGDQVNRVVTLSQRFGGLGGPGGPPQPQPVLRASDFWAQGVNFGLEFTY